MKKFLLLICNLAVAGMMSAQSPFVLAPTFSEEAVIMPYPEHISSNGQYVSCQDMLTSAPALWNVATGEVALVAIPDSVYVDPTLWGGEESPYWEHGNMTGSFTGVNNSGVACGYVANMNYQSFPVLFANNSLTYLPFDETNEGGANAWSITEDGMAVGFEIVGWNASACIWNAVTHEQKFLPMPTEEEIGFPFDYASARYVTPDGSVVLGYVADSQTGAWVAMTWKKQNNEYVVDGWMSRTLHAYVEDGQMIPATYNPFFDMEPEAISANGEWVILYATPASFDDSFPQSRAVRVNLMKHTYEAMPLDSAEVINMWTGESEIAEQAGPEMFSIANNGLAVGRYSVMDMISYQNLEDAVVWYPGEEKSRKIADLFPGDEFVEEWLTSGLSSVTPDGRYAVGQVETETDVLAFRVDLTLATSAIEQVSVRAKHDVKLIENGQIVIIRDGVKYNVMGQKL